MKQYKYIKGSEKDFEGAPEWATCVCQGANCIVFYENTDYSGRWKNEQSSSVGYNGVGGFPIIAQREPIEVWNGEGLPPVGAVFEYGTHRSIAKCIAISHLHVFASKGNPDDEESEYEEFMIPVGSEFRPVQTFEEKQLENFKNVFNAIQDKHGRATVNVYDAIRLGKLPLPAAPGFEWRYVCKCCGCRVEPGEELPHGC